MSRETRCIFEHILNSVAYCGPVGRLGQKTGGRLGCCTKVAITEQGK